MAEVGGTAADRKVLDYSTRTVRRGTSDATRLRADLCVLARAHLYDPYWTRHAAYEQGYTLPWPDPYASLVRYTPRHK